MNENKKKSPRKVTLNSGRCPINFDKEDLIEYEEGILTASIVFEHKAWECPYCGESTQYFMVNGCTISGLGMSTLFKNGKESDCCTKWECQDEQKRFHESENPKTST